MIYAPEFAEVYNTIVEKEKDNLLKKTMIVIHLADIPLRQILYTTTLVDEYYLNHQDPFLRSHYCIGITDVEEDVVQMIPDEYSGYNACGSGDRGSFDLNAINIAICVPRVYDFKNHYELLKFNEPSFGYFDKVFEKLISLVADIMIRHNIDISNVLFHREAYNCGYAAKKPCFSDFMEIHGITEEQFRKRVLEYLVKDENTPEDRREYFKRIFSEKDTYIKPEYKCRITYGDIVYRVISKEISKPNADLEKRLRDKGYKYDFRKFDCFYAYLFDTFPTREEAESLVIEMNKYGYQTQITIEDPDYEYMDERYRFKKITPYKEGDYDILKDLVYYGNPLDVYDDGKILECEEKVLHMSKPNILNGHTKSWLYLPLLNAYALIKDENEEYIKLQQ